MTYRLNLTVTTCLAIFVASCGAAPSEPYRCLESVNLQQLIQAEHLPQTQPEGWGVTSVATASENRLFDGEQEAAVVLDDPSPFLGRLCDRLKGQLAERCDVEKFWSGEEHCAAVLISPPSAVTSSGGIYTRRPVHGRVALFYSKTGREKTAIILTTTEWAN